MIPVMNEPMNTETKPMTDAEIEAREVAYLNDKDDAKENGTWVYARETPEVNASCP